MKSSRLILLLLLGFAIACGPPEAEQQQKRKPVAAVQENNPDGALSEWQVVNGLGPIKEKLSLGRINPAMVTEGEKIFETKCSMCHKLDERYVGPPLRLVTVNRTPEYVMNMMLDPTAMVKYHPEVKRLLAEYFTPMTFQNVTQEDARKILEYLRRVAKVKPEPQPANTNGQATTN